MTGFVPPRPPSTGRVETSAQGSRNAEKILKLEQDVERLLMITQALWEILKEQLEVGEDELFQRVAEIDLRDGQLDGKVAKAEAPMCPHCGRKMIGLKPVCLWCGKPAMRDLFDR